MLEGMRLGLISDIHGNLNALESCFEFLADCDQIFCLGDVVNPTAESTEVWNLLNDKKIPILRGNHEDYFLAVFDPKLNPDVANKPWFLPTRVAANHFGKSETQKLADLPLDKTLEVEGHKLYFCHASPLTNNLSFFQDMNSETRDSMNKAISAVSADLIFGGHLHRHFQGESLGKKIVCIGSVGLPLDGKPAAQCCVLDISTLEITVGLHTISYDYLGAAKKHGESGMVAAGGPVGWILLAEIIASRLLLVPFLLAEFAKADPFVDAENCAKIYLQEQNLWRQVQPYT